MNLSRPAFFLSFMLIFTYDLHAMTGKAADIPMKASPGLSIRDGEILHYIRMTGGEKDLDFYFVTRITNVSGEKTAVIYLDGISSKKGGTLPKNYQDYKRIFHVSIDNARLSESEGYYDTNNTKYAPVGFKGESYWHYMYKETDGCIDYRYYSLINNNFKESESRIKVKPGFPYWDFNSVTFFAARFMDINSPGVIYAVIPEILNTGMPFTFKNLGRETITTGAGTFQTVKLGMTVGDVFIGKLINSFIKSTYFWMEDSERKVIVRVESPFNNIELAEVSYLKKTE